MKNLLKKILKNILLPIYFFVIKEKFNGKHKITFKGFDKYSFQS